jgi:hypothetical protein
MGIIYSRLQVIDLVYQVRVLVCEFTGFFPLVRQFRFLILDNLAVYARLCFQ